MEYWISLDNDFMTVKIYDQNVQMSDLKQILFLPHVEGSYQEFTCTVFSCDKMCYQFPLRIDVQNSLSLQLA